MSALYLKAGSVLEHGQNKRAIGSWSNNLSKIIRANLEQYLSIVLLESLDDDLRETALFLGQGHASEQDA